jgi:hypothetical protein
MPGAPPQHRLMMLKVAFAGQLRSTALLPVRLGKADDPRSDVRVSTLEEEATGARLPAITPLSSGPSEVIFER